MSEEITILKEIEIEVEGTIVSLKKPIDIKIDYINCEECGKDLDFMVFSDDFGDIQISVSAKCSCKE